MSATGEPQSLLPKLDFLELAGLLRLRVAGEPFPYSFIHEASPYSADPADLVRGRDPAPGTDGNALRWYFCSAPIFQNSAGGAPRRNRQVGGGQQRRFWHPEGGKIPIRGTDGNPVGAYWRTLSYVHKTINPPAAAKPFRNERLGWCMLEFGLQQQDAGQQWEICKVYRSPLPPGPSTSAAGPGSPGVQDLADRRGMSGGDNTCPAPPPAASSPDDQSILLTSSADIVLKSNITMMEIDNTSSLGHNLFIYKTLSIFEDLGIPVDCITTSDGKMSFVLVPSQLLSGKLIKLGIDHAVEELQKYAGVHRLEGRSVIYLTGNAQMSSFILGKALSVLRSINVNVQKSLQDPSKVAHVSLVVADSEAEDCVQALRSEFHDKGFIPEVHGAAEEECTIPSNSSQAAVSSSGLKRKAVCQAARGVRPERAEITDPSGSSVVVQSGNDPIPAMATGALEDEEYLSWMQQDEVDGAQGLADTNGITLEEMELMLLSDIDYPLVKSMGLDVPEGLDGPDVLANPPPQPHKKSLTQFLLGSLAEDFVAAIRSLAGCCCWATCRKRDATLKREFRGGLSGAAAETSPRQPGLLPGA